MRSIPPKERAGSSSATLIKSTRGSGKPGRAWPCTSTSHGKAWLPDDWCQGVKRTHGGNTYVVFLPPTEIRTLYHQWQIEDYLGRKLGPQDGFKGQLRLAKLAREQVQLDPEDAFFALLSAHERAQLVDGSAFHFCIVSARRAQVPEGARDIAVVQDAFTSPGVAPAWYVVCTCPPV